MASKLFRKDGTAQAVAKQRLIESIAAPDKQVICDPYADLFVRGGFIIKCLGHGVNVWLSSMRAPGLHESLIARTRAIDDLVKECAAAGASQYLILGAGYDMRAYRLDLPSSLKVFEVDQQEVQDLKKSGMPPDLLATGKATYVSVDFNTQTLTDQLVKAGFQAGRLTIVTLEGVSQYIPKEAAEKTLKEVGALCGLGSTIFLSYVEEAWQTCPSACFSEGYPKPEATAALVNSTVAKMGEPWISFYKPDEMKAVLQTCGFDLASDTTLADVNQEYFGAVGRLVPPDGLMKMEHFFVAKKK